MSNALFSRSDHTVRQSRRRLEVELLEGRTLPSVNIVEAEPNDTVAQANVIPHILDTPVKVIGNVDTPADRDWFSIQFEQGDVLGAIVKGKNGLNPEIRLVNSTGDLMIANDDSLDFGKTYLPNESPLPHGHVSDTDSEIYYVISTAGTYFLQVSASNDESTGTFSMDLMVARPGLEAQPVGTKQILFLDFDGAIVNFNHFTNQLISGKKTLAPLADSLPEWGMTAADENAIIDGIVANVTDKLSTFVQANGLNSNMGVEIWNSRDHADPGLNPLVSRIVIGGAGGDPDIPANVGGIAQGYDMGNFKNDDQAVVFLGYITGGLNAIPIQPPATARDFLVAGISTILAHETGHILGCVHTDQSPTDLTAGTPNLMDSNAAFEALGPDVVFGSADDINLQFGVDTYYQGEQFRGQHDTLNTVAFGLSTGSASALHAAVIGGTRVANTLQATQAQSVLTEVIARWQSAAFNVSALNGIDFRMANLPDDQGKQSRADLWQAYASVGMAHALGHQDHSLVTQTLAAEKRATPAITADEAFLTGMLINQSLHHLAA